MGQHQQRPSRGDGVEIGDEGARGGLVEVLGRLVEDEDPRHRRAAPGRARAAVADHPRAARHARRPPLPGRPGAIGPSRAAAPDASAASSSTSGAPGRASRRLSARVASKMCGSCSHRPTAARTASPAASRTSTHRPHRRARASRRPDRGTAGRRPPACSCRTRSGPVTTTRCRPPPQGRARPARRPMHPDSGAGGPERVGRADPRASPAAKRPVGDRHPGRVRTSVTRLAEAASPGS